MKIKYINGDLFNTQLKVIMHGCNARGGFNSGVAGEIRKQYPKAYEVYKEAHNNGLLELGRIFYAVDNGKLIINAITQKNYGRDKNIVYCDYRAIEEVMFRCNEFCNNIYPFDNVAMPMIGAGLANGDWDIISKIIEKELTDVRPVVYYL